MRLGGFWKLGFRDSGFQRSEFRVLRATAYCLGRCDSTYFTATEKVGVKRLVSSFGHRLSGSIVCCTLVVVPSLHSLLKLMKPL